MLLDKIITYYKTKTMNHFIMNQFFLLKNYLLSAFSYQIKYSLLSLWNNSDKIKFVDSYTQKVLSKSPKIKRPIVYKLETRVRDQHMRLIALHLFQKKFYLLKNLLDLKIITLVGKNHHLFGMLITKTKVYMKIVTLLLQTKTHTDIYSIKT